MALHYALNDHESLMSSYHYQEFKFRIGHDRVTYSVQFLILMNVAFFAGQLILDIPFGAAPEFDTPGGRTVIDWVAFSPIDFAHGFVWQPLSYMFIHSGLSHLFFNMLMLYFFGPDVERLLGTRQFYRFYLACGAVAVLANYVPILLGESANISVVGASGATLAVLMAFAMAEPDRQIILFPIPIPVNARALVIIIIVMNLLAAASGGGRASVATHFGGMLAGYLFMKYRPLLTQWRAKRRWRKGPSVKEQKDLGTAIDNIFKLQDKDR